MKLTQGSTFGFFGRPDGLGNRIEEIILLEQICQQNDVFIDYLWLNSTKRWYMCCLTADRVSIRYWPKLCQPRRKIADFEYSINQKTMRDAATRIKPNFEISFASDINPIGVHIRASDRIGKDHPHFMKDENELKQLMAETISAINSLSPSHLFICSESEVCKKVFLKYLNKDIMVVEPTCDNEISSEYIDLFGLSLCKEIWMVSKFSSFSVIASLIGDKPLIGFTDAEILASRYFVNYHKREKVGVPTFPEPLLNKYHFIKNMITKVKERFS